jgi:hypothetical protein
MLLMPNITPKKPLIMIITHNYIIKMLIFAIKMQNRVNLVVIVREMGQEDKHIWIHYIVITMIMIIEGDFSQINKTTTLHLLHTIAVFNF